MKKLLILSVVAILAISGQNSTALKIHDSNTSATQSRLSSYTWYLDADMEQPTGTISSIGAELARLRNLYPGYVFSSSFSLGLHEYEYGDSPYYFTAIIFSNH